VLALVACSPIISPTAGTAATEIPATVLPIPEAEEDAMNLGHSDVAAAAQADLAERLSIAVDQIKVLEMRAVTWPDPSLGCPQPGRVYAQVTHEGWLIRLGVGDETYFYHSGSDQKPFLCKQLSQIIPNMPPKVDELIPPPGRQID
jgi:hypothetical protein